MNQEKFDKFVGIAKSEIDQVEPYNKTALETMEVKELMVQAAQALERMKDSYLNKRFDISIKQAGLVTFCLVESLDKISDKM